MSFVSPKKQFQSPPRASRLKSPGKTSKTTRVPGTLAKSPSKLLSSPQKRDMLSPSVKGGSIMSPQKSTMTSSKTMRSPTKTGKKTQIWDVKGNLIKRVSNLEELEIVHEKFLNVLEHGIYVAWTRLIEFVYQCQEEARTKTRSAPVGDDAID